MSIYLNGGSDLTRVEFNGEQMFEVWFNDERVYQFSDLKSPQIYTTNQTSINIPAKTAWITAVGKGGKGGSSSGAYRYDWLSPTAPSGPTTVTCSHNGSTFATVTAEGGGNAGNSKNGGSGRVKGSNAVSKNRAGDGGAGVSFPEFNLADPVADTGRIGKYSKSTGWHGTGTASYGGTGWGAGGGGEGGQRGTFGGGGSGRLVTQKVTSPGNSMTINISLDTYKNPGGSFRGGALWGMGANGLVIVEW